MDPLTHLFSGSLLARGLDEKLTKPVIITLVAAALLPDIDHITLRTLGWEAYLKYHRGFTHSFAGSIPLALILSLSIKKIFKENAPPIKRLFIFSLAGIYGHIFLDLITSYGTMLLYPFSTRRFSLDLVFIIDPYVTGLFLSAILLAWRFKRKMRTIVFASVVLFVFYLVFASVNKSRAEKVFLENARGLNVFRYKVYPAPFSSFNWMAVAEGKDALYIARIKRNAITLEEYKKEPLEGYISAAKKNSLVATYLWFAEFPWVTSYETGERGRVVEFLDLRFYSFPDRKPFLLKAVFDKNGNLVNVYMD